jgi:FixJ family two-component response regulator
MHDGEQKIVLAVQGAIDRQAEQERKADAYQGLVDALMSIHQRDNSIMGDIAEAALKAAGELK